MSRQRADARLVVCLVLALWSVAPFPKSFVCSFAYAPNFITKIIQDQTSIVPTGAFVETLLDDVKESEEAIDNHVDDGALKDVARTKSIVKTRFPPEPNGYLHLGHAKAISFNFAVARSFGGVCHMRLDDTNPSKEDKEYVDSILEDVVWIQQGLYNDDKQAVPWDGPVRKTSDYFDLIYDCAVALVKSGDAYVDSLSAEEMRQYRGTLTEAGIDSPFRTRSIEENLQLFQDMRAGKYAEGTLVLRAKIAMDSPNINMRDPTLYRIKHESHQETGDAWCIYPMYDFSHPIADAVENITHSLCTLEFEDHRPFYDWTIQKLRAAGLLNAQPQQIEFSRLNIKSTVLSKRKLIQLVQEKHVDGWDDPRLPTLSGLRRRGISPEALRMFCERVGISKAHSNIDYSVLEDCVRETMDSNCPRAFAVLEPLKVTLTNYEHDGAEMECFLVDRHPKLDMGQRSIPFGESLCIERSDFFDAQGPEGERNGGEIPNGFKRLLPNGLVRLRYAYVIQCDEIVRDPVSQEPVELKCTYYPETRAGVTPDGMDRVKGIIHWVEATTSIPCTINQYDRLFAVEEPGKESGDFLKDINPQSLNVLRGSIVEPSVGADAESVLDRIKHQNEAGGKIYPSMLTYQFERSGYFALDKTTTDKTDIVFNRVVTLRNTWGVEQQSARPTAQRSRGSTGGRASTEVQPSEDAVEDIRRASIRAATILSAEPHPEAENLLVCQVDCGDVGEDGTESSPRTVVAGLAGKIPRDQLVGRKVLAITNLKPAKMRGIESTAMLLAAADTGGGKEEIVELLQVPDNVPNGELIGFEGKEPCVPDAMLKSKGAMKAWERAKAGLRLNMDGEASYTDDSGTYRMLSTAGPIRAATLSDAPIQ
jgi:glutaminyl-tRNA synthetase